MANGNFERSEYFHQIIRVFDRIPDEGTRRAYVTALILCFDLNDGNPHHPSMVAADHGFDQYKIHDFRFVLHKRSATKFFVTDAALPGVRGSDIRNISDGVYATTFGRSPYLRGKSSYWFSVSEWITLLNAPGEIPIPQKLREFAEVHNIKQR